MLASDTHGRPFGKFAATCCCCEPAEMSVTVPLITTSVPKGSAVSSQFPRSHANAVYLVVIAIDRYQDTV